MTRRDKCDRIIDRLLDIAAGSDDVNVVYVVAQLLPHFEHFKEGYDEPRPEEPIGQPVPPRRPRGGGEGGARRGKAKPQAKETEDAGRQAGKSRGNRKTLRYRCICPPGSTCQCGSVESATFPDRVRPRRDMGTPNWFREDFDREWPL